MGTHSNLNIETLAHNLNVTTEAITALVDQLADDADYWNADTETLTPVGAEVVTAAVRDAATGDVESDVAEAVAALTDARHTVGEAFERRDTEIRRALRSGISYARLEEITGLSRSSLDTIRQGRRRR